MEKYPKERLVLRDLKFDAIYFNEKNRENFWKTLIPSLGLLLACNLTGRTLPILRLKGWFFGTNR